MSTGPDRTPLLSQTADMFCPTAENGIDFVQEGVVCAAAASVQARCPKRRWGRNRGWQMIHLTTLVDWRPSLVGWTGWRRASIVVVVDRDI